MLAHLIDVVVQVVALGIVVLVAGAAAAGGILNPASFAAVTLSSLVLALVGYPVTVETLSRGRTVGKLALGLRVVADDGGPVRFRQALVRGLAGVVECWLLAGIPALITSMLSARGKRLGDIFAGTFVLRERAARPSAVPFPAAQYPAAQYPAAQYPAAQYPAAQYPAAQAPFPAAAHGTGGGLRSPVSFVEPALRPWAAMLDLSGLPEPLAGSVASYLSRYWQLDAAARDRLGLQLAADVAARVSPPPPPGLPPVAYLHAVLAERRSRELARLQAAPPAGFAGYAHVPTSVQQPAPPPPAATPEPAPSPVQQPADNRGFAPPA